jgi:hypothetical protein
MAEKTDHDMIVEMYTILTGDFGLQSQVGEQKANCERRMTAVEKRMDSLNLGLVKLSALLIGAGLAGGGVTIGVDKVLGG